MTVHKILGLLVAGLLIAGSGGCCCVDTCCTSSCDFGGGACNQLCGMECSSGGCGGGIALGGGCSSCDSCTTGSCTSDTCGDPCGDCAPACGTMVGNFTTRQMGANDCGCDSCTSSCGGGLGSGCFGWNVPQFFVDGNGRPCLGPISNLARAMRSAAQNCGCGSLYVDEWISDPPLCSDPCDSSFSGGDSCGCACSQKIDNVMAKRKYNWGGRSQSACSDCQSQTASQSYQRSPHTQHISHTKGTYSKPSHVSKASYKKPHPSKRNVKQPVSRAGWFN